MNDFKTALAEIIINFDNYIALTRLRAKLCREYYKQLLKEGYTEAQALELCKYFNII